MSKIYNLETRETLASSLDLNKPVFLDTETAKLGSDIRLVQVYQEGWPSAMVFDATDTNISILWFILQPYHLVGHNLGYDFGCFSTDMPEGAFELPKKWSDTFYMARLAFPKWQKYSLDMCLTQALGYDPYAAEKLNKKKLQMSFERLKVKDRYIEGPEGLKPLTEGQLLYASLDVYHLPALYNKVKHKEDDINHILDKLSIEHGMELKKGGMPLDWDRLKEMEHEYNATALEVAKQLPTGFKVNSYQQVRKLLGSVLSSDETKLTIIRSRPRGLEDLWFRIQRGPNGWPKAMLKGIEDLTIEVKIKQFGREIAVTDVSQLPEDNKSLVYFKEINYRHSEECVRNADLIIKARKALKRLNFIERARTNAAEDGRLHPTLSPHAISGRVQQSDENLAQYPRDMKTMFGLTDKNSVLIYADYSQLELRAICALLPERAMEKAYRSGQDIHTVAGENLHLDESKLPPGMGVRNVAKMCNFLNLYGGGTANFQNVVTKFAGVWLEEDLVKEVTRKWAEGFPDIKAWHKRNQKNTSLIDTTILGRTYNADTVTDLNNIRVSGSAAEAAKLAFHYIYKYLIPKYKNVRALNFVIDSFVLEAPNDPTIYKEVARDLSICMFMGWREAMKTAAVPDIPMPVESKVGFNWGDIENDVNVLYKITLDGDFSFDYFKEFER